MPTPYQIIFRHVSVTDIFDSFIRKRISHLSLHEPSIRAIKLVIDGRENERANARYRAELSVALGKKRLSAQVTGSDQYLVVRDVFSELRLRLMRVSEGDEGPVAASPLPASDFALSSS